MATFLLLAAAVAAGFLVPGCREQATGLVDRNLPPETVLTFIPGDSSRGNFYRLRLYWHGSDPDGEVMAYEWAVTESLPNLDEVLFRRTLRSDSVFTLSVGRDVFTLGHRFYVRAVDNEGKVDPTPAWSFFSVVNNKAPTVRFIRATKTSPDGSVADTIRTTPVDTIPSGWSVSFAWQGGDGDVALNPDGTIDSVGRVVSYAHRLVPAESNFSPPALSDTTAKYADSGTSPRNGLYTLEVQATDDAGFSGVVPFRLNFVWNRDPETFFSREYVGPGSTDSVEVFYADTLGDGDYSAWFRDGDTLRLTPALPKVAALVRAFDPDGTEPVDVYEARLVRDSAFWTRLTSENHEFKPDEPIYTGHYQLMARTQDRRGRWDGTPANISFDINYPPRFIVEGSVGGQDFSQFPRSGGVYPTSGTDTTLTVRFAGVDPDRIPAMNGLEFTYLFESFPTATGEGHEVFFRSPWVHGNDGIWEQVVLLPEHQVYLPGRYHLLVAAREAFDLLDQRDLYGYRTSVDTVSFELR